MKNYQYILEPYKGPKSRYTCPSCGSKGKFTKYINNINSIYISDIVGRCDREHNCGYHYTPAQYFADHPECNCNNIGVSTLVTKEQLVTNVTTVTAPLQYLPFEVMERSIAQCRRSSLFQFLGLLFTDIVAEKICHDFFIGASREGHTVFWQVDIAGNIRQAKVMQYDPHTGRRNKETGAQFVGKKILADNEANLRQCLFGEYQLSIPEISNKPVAIVESEKTAVIASVYYPQFIWLATGGKHGCKWTEAKGCAPLAKRKIILFPDLGAYDAWKVKGELISAVAGCKVGVSRLLEDIATDEEKRGGLDLADFLLRKTDNTGLAVTDSGYPVIWDLIKSTKMN